jgi:tetratricopeptide (TPR) repeat protein
VNADGYAPDVRSRRRLWWVVAGVVLTAVFMVILIVGVKEGEVFLSAVSIVVGVLVSIGTALWVQVVQTQPARAPALAAPVPETGTPVRIVHLAADLAWARWLHIGLVRSGCDANLHSLNTLTLAASAGAAPTMPTDGHLVLVASPSLLASGRWLDRWIAQAVEARPDGDRVTAVRVQQCELPPALASLVTVDIVGLDEDAALAHVVESLTAHGARRHGGVSPEALPGPVRFPARGPAVSNLPPRIPLFTGRASQLDLIHNYLAANVTPGRVQACAVHGLGGVGKTQLAVEYAHRYASEYEVTWWVRAANRARTVDDLRDLARHIGVPDTKIQDELLVDLWNQLRTKGRWLIVFDNAEDPETLRGVWPRGGAGDLLITSRNPAWGGMADTTFRLEPLPAADAVAFLRKRTRSDDGKSLADIAETLDGLPLALEQAGAYVERTHTTPSRYRDLLRSQHSRLMASGQPPPYYDNDDGNRLVATTWSVSMEKATEEEPAARDLLALCAFLAPDDIRPELLTAHPDVLPPTLRSVLPYRLGYDRTITSVTRYSLLTVDNDRLAIHRLVQAVVRESLTRQERRDFLQLAVDLIDRAFPADQADLKNWRRCAPLVPHVAFVSELARSKEVTGGELSVGAADNLAALLHRVGQYLDRRGEWVQARTLLERALDLRRTAHGPQHQDVAETLCALGRVQFVLAKVSEARRSCMEALGIRDRDPSTPPATKADNLLLLGWVLRESIDHAEALRFTEDAIQIYREECGPDSKEVGDALCWLGVVKRNVGRLGGARVAYEQALVRQLAAYGSEHASVALTHCFMGLVYQDLRELELARRELETSIAILEGTYGRDHFEVAQVEKFLGDILRRLGDVEQAEHRLQRVVSLHEKRESAEEHKLAACLNKWGSLQLALGQPDQAREALERARRIFCNVYGDDHPYVAKSLVRLGPVLRALDQAPEAEQALRTAEKIFTACYGPDHPALATILEYRADLHADRRDLAVAVGLRSRANEILHIAARRD